MFTPKKIRRLDVHAANEYIGYIVKVSPIKTSKSKKMYFDGVLQVSETVYKRFVCFDTFKQNDFTLSIQKPVKLSNVLLVRRRKTNDLDIKVTRYSTMEIKQCLEFAFKPPIETDKKTDVKRCMEMPPYENTSLTAKVVCIGEEEVKKVRGFPMKLSNIKIEDETESIRLSLWNEHIKEVELNNFYTFENVKTRVYKGISCLTTSPQSKITKANNCDLPEPVNFNPSYLAWFKTQNVIGTVTHIILYKNLICTNCKKNVQKEIQKEISFIRCSNCSMKQKTKCLSVSVQGNLNVELDLGEKIKLSVFPSVLNTFLTQESKIDLLTDIEALEEFFLTTGKLQFQFSTYNDNVSKISRPKTAEASQAASNVITAAK